MIQTERLLIVKAEMMDIDYIIGMEHHEENRPYIWQGTYEEHQEEIQDRNHLLCLVKDKKNLEEVGYFLAHIDERSHRFELRRIALSQKGHGYGEEIIRALMKDAFENRNINRFWLDVYPTNKVGIALYEKLGMKREGVLRQNYKNEEGEYMDQIIYALLKEEYQAQ